MAKDKSSKGGIRLFLGKLFGGKDEPEGPIYDKEIIDQAIQKADATFPELTDEQKVALSQAVKRFFETSGVTIGDVMDSLGPSIDEQRALEIANFMITTSHADREEQQGKRLQDEFSDIPVVKTWFTCNDDRCCDNCRSNHAKTVLIDNPFPSGHMKPPGCDDCRCSLSTRTDILGEAVNWP